MFSKKYWKYFGYLICKSFHGAFRLLEGAEVIVAIGIGVACYFWPAWRDSLEVLFLILVGLFFLTLLCGMILAAHILDEKKENGLAGLKTFLQLPQARDQFQQSILVFRAEVFPALGTTDPYVIFTFWLFNGSLNSVYLKSVKGRAKFLGEELSYGIDLQDDQHDVPHGGRYRFRLRQSVSREAATKVAKITNAENGAMPQFSFDSVLLTITSHDPGFENWERRLDLPDIVFRREWHIRWPS